MYYVIDYCINNREKYTKIHFIQGLLLIPLALPVAALKVLWEDLFMKERIVNELLHTQIDWLQSKYAPFVIIGIILWKNIGYDVLLIISSLLTMPSEYEEAASMEGAGFWRIGFSIKIPYLIPILFFTSIISLLNCFKIFREIYILQGDYPYEKIYLLQHFMNNNFLKLNYEILATAAFVLYVIIFIVIYIVTKWQQVYIKENV